MPEDHAHKSFVSVLQIGCGLQDSASFTPAETDVNQLQNVPVLQAIRRFGLFRRPTIIESGVVSISIVSFLPHYGPGVDSASNRNEYQEYFLGGKDGR